MNGRVYDADIGRFLQADPHIQAPRNSQNYNRYSYVLNNPMSYTDPSGYFFKKLGKFVKKYWRVAVAAVATYFTMGAATGWAASWAGSLGLTTTGYVGTYAITTLSTAGTIFAGAVAGSIAGAVGGFIATGSLKGTLRGATSGAVFGGIGAGFTAYGVENVAAQMSIHAIAGGVLSDLQGGNFGHGFITAGVMKGFGKLATQDSIGRVLVQAIAGGTVSKLTGGKFGNGAITAALQYIVNEIASRKLQASIGIKKLTGALEAEYDTQKGFGAKFKTELKNGPVTVELDTDGQVKVMTGSGNQIGSTIDGSKYGLDGKIDVKVASFELSVKPNSGVLSVEWKVGISSGIFSGAYAQVHQYDMSTIPLFKNWNDYYGGAGKRADYICSRAKSLSACN